MADEIFEPGDQAVCVDSRSYDFTPGKTYTILKYEPRGTDGVSPFVWPAYVEVEDDGGERTFCHARRFKRVAEDAADE